jgi:hypothetical protein
MAGRCWVGTSAARADRCVPVENRTQVRRADLAATQETIMDHELLEAIRAIVREELGRVGGELLDVEGSPGLLRSR